MAPDEDEPNNPVHAPELLEHISALNDEGSGSRTLSPQSRLGEDEPRRAAMAGSLTISLSRRESGLETAAPIFFDELEGEEWVALFVDVLGCPAGVATPRSQDDDLNERVERFRSQFQEKTRDYPMLGRLMSPYADVSYTPAEVVELRDECLQLRLRATSNEAAMAGLETLKNASDEAIKSGSGLELMCD